MACHVKFLIEENSIKIKIKGKYLKPKINFKAIIFLNIIYMTVHNISSSLYEPLLFITY